MITLAVNFQQRATKEGHLAQEIAERVLIGAGFQILERNCLFRGLGVTLNFICTDKEERKWYFDVSGAFSSSRAGLIRTDTVWKALGKASVLSVGEIRPFILLTTNLPKSGSAGDIALHKARPYFFDAIEMTSPTERKRLQIYANGHSQQNPLPGFWDAGDAYGANLRSGGIAGADLSVPLEITGDPLGSSLGFDIKERPHRLKVYLPSQTKDGQPIPASERTSVVNNVKSIMADLAGGCTSETGRGSWVDPFTGLVDEDVEMIETYMLNPVPEEILRKIVDLILTNLNQATVAVVVNQEMLHFSSYASP